MGIVINQSIKNTIITYIGFAIGAANALYMYPKFLGEQYYGLTGYILSSANVIFPLMAFGVHNTLIKFFSHYKSQKEIITQEEYTDIKKLVLENTKEHCKEILQKFLVKLNKRRKRLNSRK